MGDKTGISWTEATWNPTVGCSLKSPGCTNCYAMKQAQRISHMQPESHYFGTTKVVNGNAVWTGLLKQAPESILTAPLRWKKPRMIFVNSMSDLFHESVPDEWIEQVFAVMIICKHHKFQILTKRSKRMREYIIRWVRKVSTEKTLKVADSLDSKVDDVLMNLLLPNVWFGVSCEDQQRADERIPDLLGTPAAVRFVSYEPALGPIDFRRLDFQMSPDHLTGRPNSRAVHLDALNGWYLDQDTGYRTRHDAPAKLNWIICGGESGPGHRPMQIEWAESIRQQCAAAGTSYFFKQDSGPKSGMRGRASDELWACKEFPK